MNWKMILIIAAVVFFIVGMISGNYHCGDNFCSCINAFVNFISDVVKTEVHGITTIVGGISKVFN